MKLHADQKASTTINLICVLDASGSMAGSVDKVISNYNEFVQQHKQLTTPGVEYVVSLYTFSTTVNEVYRKQPIETVPELTTAEYTPFGGTALYDAIGYAIAQNLNDDKVFIQIDTDGWENSSKEFNASTIKQLVSDQTEKGWDFTFIGADLSAADTRSMSSQLGFAAVDTMAFAKSADGYSARASAVNAKLASYSSFVMNETVSTISESVETI